MNNKWLMAVALASVSLWTGCATGGGGHNQGPLITVSDGNVSNVAVTLTVQFTVTVQNSPQAAVSWSVKQNGTVCSPTCGKIDADTGLYTAPATPPPNSGAVDVTATLQSDPRFSGKLTITVLPVTVNVTPKLNNSVAVVKGAQQQFSSRALPDDGRAQSVTWSLACDAAPSPCGTIGSDGLYTAPSTIPNPATAHITATSTIDPTGADTSDILITASRLSGTYAFHLSGFDAGGSAVAVAGNFQTNGSGGIIGGTEDELTATQQFSRTITGGSLSIDNNVHGTLTLTTSAGTHTYKVVFDAEGDGKLIQFDSGGTGSGEIIQATSKAKDDALLPPSSTFVFGLSGVDTVLNPAGFVGMIQPNGAGAISSGQLDFKEGGTVANGTLSGTYDIQSNGRGTLHVTTSGHTYNYAIYVASGVTNKAANPLTLFAISTDDPQVNPAVSGTIVFQDPTPSYVNSDMTGFWVASLTGIDTAGNTLVSLTLGSGDGQSTGHTSGKFDANNTGTILSNKNFSNYAYASTGGGRYTLDLLGDPSANPVVAPEHFVLYSSAAGRGFLLSVGNNTTVYTGQLDQQSSGTFGPSEMSGSFAAATASVGSSSSNHAALNLLFTSLQPDFTVAGKQDITGSTIPEPLAGTYSVDFDGTSTMNLTQPSTQKYVFYALDQSSKASGNMVQHFVMIDVDSSNASPALIFGER